SLPPTVARCSMVWLPAQSKSPQGATYRAVVVPNGKGDHRFVAQRIVYVEAVRGSQGAPGSLVGMAHWRRTMERESRPTNDTEAPRRSHMNAAFVVSAQSVVSTVVASSAAIALGLGSHTAVLVAFGAIGFVDAIGSVALMYHFRHALRHDRLSDHLEKLSHRIVLVGLLLVGSAAIIGGLTRLVMDQSSEPSNAGVALAATSLVVLTVLSARKQSIARRVSSNALRSDGHLSGIGAMQAGVTLAGTAVTRWVGWQWADAAATAVVGCVAATLALVTWSVDVRQRRTPNPGSDPGQVLQKPRHAT
ncbi:MAG: hypothetical protein QOD72_762, partial [Acidimicrobiaceae bacterium]|nr:hypothetical protein [Acidimicrobiaceae bacterium]